MREDGSVLVLSMIILIILVIFLLSLGMVINNEIKMVAANINGSRAVYYAEAGIEHVYNKIKGDLSVNTDVLEQISGFNDGEYSVTSVEKDGIIYTVTSRGISGGIAREITARITVESDTDARTLTAEGEITREYTSGHGKGGKTWETIVAGDSFISGVTVKDLTRDQFVSFVDNHINTYTYSSDRQFNEEEFNDLLYDVIFVDGNLELTDNGNNNYLNGGDQPLLVLVSGDIYIEGFRNIANMIFLTLGDFEYNQPNAHIDFTNSFIYAGNNITFNKNMGNSQGNPTLSPHFEFSGQIIAGNDITMLTKDGVANQIDYNIELPEEFANITTVTIDRPTIIGWREN